jgi:hypothetical protein
MAKKQEDLLRFESRGEWVVIDKFDGWQTDVDPTKIKDGSNPEGQNTTVNNVDRVSVRNVGFEPFPTNFSSILTLPVTSLHTFRRRDGSSILMAAWGTHMDYYNPLSGSWETLTAGYTSGLKFGFGDYTLHTDLSSKCYFGNAVDNWSYWTGNYTYATSAIANGAGTINVGDTTGFPDTGTISINGDEYTYGSKTNTSFVLTGVTTAAYAINIGVAESIHMEGAATYPKGNIYLVTSNRLFISGVVGAPQAVYFSKYGDPADFSSSALITGSTATASGVFNLAEGGGGVIGNILDEGSIYFFKKSITYKATLSDTLYTLQALKPFDGKSQTTGATTARSIFTSGNGTFLVTPDNQIMFLKRIEQIDYPQNQVVSESISTTVNGLYFDDATGIVFNDIAYLACKSTKTSPFNDTVLVYNISNQCWDSPIVGWNVSDFTIYDNGSGEELYFSSATSPTVYRVTNTPLDDVYSVSANWRSKQFNFGMPQKQKELNNLYIEGYIAPNTELTISLLFDEDGYNKIYTTTLRGTEDSILYDSTTFNVFGFTPFGTERFGSNDDNSGKKKFRVYLNKDVRLTPFYNCQLEFASDGENQQWEIINFAFLVKEYNVVEKRELIRSFK